MNNTRNHDTGYNVVHPQCRGYVHKPCFIQLATKPQFDLRTQLQIPSVLKKPRTQQQAPAHTAAGLSSIFFTKTLCAHSCRGRPRTQLGLNLSLQNQP